MINGAPIAVTISNCIYLMAAVIGTVAACSVGLPLRRRIIALAMPDPKPDPFPPARPTNPAPPVNPVTPPGTK